MKTTRETQFQNYAKSHGPVNEKNLMQFLNNYCKRYQSQKSHKSFVIVILVYMLTSEICYSSKYLLFQKKAEISCSWPVT